MKTKLLSSFLLLFVFCHLAAAQDYQIRTGANINLRDTYSLEGAVVEVDPSGSILQVVGQFNRWLRINRSGNTLWMADWVPYTGVGDGGQTQSQIDNCCFVDRQCTVDAEWTSGYQAFQNGQCMAPLQTGLQLPLTSAGSVSSEVNNCCFLNWQCSNDAAWERGYRAFQLGQCNLPPGLIIEGPADFVAKWKDVLRLLERTSPKWYAYAVGGVARIRQVERSGVQSIHTSTATMSISRNNVFLDERFHGYRPLSSMASLLVHEACHVYRFRAGLQPGGYEGEKACLTTEIEAAKIFHEPGLVPGLQYVLDRIDDPEWQWWLFHSCE